MRKIKYLTLAAAALTLAACSNEEEAAITGSLVEARISTGLIAHTTRAIGTNWNADKIGVMVTAAPSSDMETLYKNVLYTTDSKGASADFSAAEGKGIFFQDATETVTFAAYAPYQESTDNATLPGTGGVVEVNTDNMNTDTEQEKIDFLFASGATASRQIPTVTFADATPDTPNDADDYSFHHKMAQLKVVFQVSTNDGFSAEDIFKESNTFNLGGLMHKGTFNVTNGTAAATGEKKDDWDISDCKHEDATTTRTYSLILLPQNLNSNPLNVAVVIDGQTYRNTTNVNPNLEAGKTCTYTITVKKEDLAVSGCKITDWTGGDGGNGDATME